MARALSSVLSGRVFGRIDIFESEALAVGDAVGLAEPAGFFDELLELHAGHYTFVVRALVVGQFLFQTGRAVKPHPQKSEQPTTRFLREHVQRLFANLPGAKAGQEEPIHQIRVASRRLRVALPVAARKPAGRRVRRSSSACVTLTRLAGQGRDLDVGAALFD